MHSPQITYLVSQRMCVEFAATMSFITVISHACKAWIRWTSVHAISAKKKAKNLLDSDSPIDSGHLRIVTHWMDCLNSLRLFIPVPPKASPKAKRFSPLAAVKSRYEIFNYATMPGIACPCGTARRGLMEVDSVPYSLHVTQIEATAKSHYHIRLTETYFILECDEGSSLELDGEFVPVKPNMAFVIHPGTRHRAVGNMKLLIVASPKFDPSDEWFD